VNTANFPAVENKLTRINNMPNILRITVAKLVKPKNNQHVLSKIIF